MRMKRLFFIFSFIICFLLCFNSCNFGAGQNTQNSDEDKKDNSSLNDSENGEGKEDDEVKDDLDNTTNEPTLEEGQTYYYSKSEIMIVYAENNDCTDAAFSLLGEIDSNLVGKDGYAFIGYQSQSNKNEIIIGSVPQRKASAEAYKLLYELESGSQIRESRYLVYAEDGKIAFAYEENPYTSLQSIKYVVDMFVREFISGKDELLLNKGVVMSGTIDFVKIQEEIDKAETESRWEIVREKIGNDDTYLAYRSFCEQLFTDEIVDLIAKNYDPATGLFYASQSGKRAEGIYPIPEATSSSLSYVLNTGMLNGMGVLYLLPDVAKYKIVYYIKSIQAPDGEFYVSQMEVSKIDSNRIGRDRGACLGLLERLGEKPTYSVGSVVGDGINGETYWANLVAAGLVTAEEKPIIYWAADKASRIEPKGSFRESVASAVSKVVPTASGTEQFQSHEEFIKWLLAKDPYNNPYTAMSNTSSAASLISDWSEKLGGYEGSDTVVYYGSKSMELYQGETLNEILIRWMNSNINEAGLFW